MTGSTGHSENILDVEGYAFKRVSAYIEYLTTDSVERTWALRSKENSQTSRQITILNFPEWEVPQEALSQMSVDASSSSQYDQGSMKYE